MAEATLDRGSKNRSSGRASRRYGWLLGRELLVIAVLFVAYRFVRALVKDEFVVAYRNAHRVIDWERTIGIFNEVRLQSGVLSNDAVIWFLNRYYFFGHFVGAAALLVWLYTRHYERYGRVRRVMAITTVAALAMHVAFPLAPPRWFPNLGFVDTLQTYGPKVYDSATVTATANQIAAMPSLHVGWALCIAWAVIIASSRRWRWLIAAHPVVMTFAVVLTANHWWLDALVAAALVVVAIWIDTPIQRWLERRQDRVRVDDRTSGPIDLTDGDGDTSESGTRPDLVEVG
jgi:hypothetical protein